MPANCLPRIESGLLVVTLVYDVKGESPTYLLVGFNAILEKLLCRDSPSLQLRNR